MKASLLLIGLLSAGVALAGPPAPKTQGIEGKDYKWNAEGGEKSEALKLKGDKKRVEEAYEVCGACHLPSCPGHPDG
ncbi:MAG: cytochrome C, partial [Betaproteobacteria bacterium]